MIDPRLGSRLVGAAARKVSSSQEELSRLDAVAGDGDHGVNMAAALDEAARRCDGSDIDTIGAVFRTAGKAFHDTVGGAAGALFGAFFSALGARLRQAESPDTSDFVEGLRGGLARVGRIGRSAPGQKTMIDALAPAVERAENALNTDHRLEYVLAAAAMGAREGATATATMRPAAGRARYAPDAAMGSEDPGANTVALIFEAWAEELDSGGRA